MQKFNKKSFHKRLGEKHKSDFMMNYKSPVLNNLGEKNKYKLSFNNVLKEMIKK